MADTIHYSELTDPPADSPHYEEWRTYRRALPELLKNGNQGRFVLIKVSEVVGTYDSLDAARREGLKRFLMETFLMHQIRAEEPAYRIPYPCRS